MKLAATIARSFQADMQAELRDIERAVATRTRDAGRGLRTELRRQVSSAGLGQRLANSWRDKHYPNQKFDAASLVYTKAPQIIRAFDEGAVIRSKRGRFSRYRAACRRGHQTPWKIDNVVRRRIATHVGVRRFLRSRHTGAIELMNWYLVLLAGLGLLILCVAWLPALVRGFPLSLPIGCVLLGFALFSIPGTGPDPNLLEHPHLAERLTELTVIVALMGAGLKLNRPLGWRRWATTWRLLGLAMPLSIAAIALLGSGLLGLTAGSALLLGAALAPTDPVLASSVQVGPPQEPEEDEVRFALTSEAGLNDGLAFPFVHLAIAVALHGTGLGTWTWEWLGVAVLWKIAGGIGFGLLVGQALGYVIFHYVERSPSLEAGDALVAFGITLLAYGVAELAHAYGFLAVFVTALTLRRQERSHHYRARLHEFSEQLERLLMMVLLVLFGGALAGGLLAPLTWGAAAVGLLCLLVVRPLAGLVALAGSGLRFDERAAISFFGIRGVGSFYYLAYGYNTEAFGVLDLVFALVGFVVFGSILLHGIMAAPVMAWLDRRWRAASAARY
jgi:sodium/hydrogen antiporter